MNRPELVQLFKRLATEIAEKDFGAFSEQTSIADLGMDSLAMLELIGAMERELQIRIPDEDLVGIQTVQQLLDLIDNKRAYVSAKS